jgi:hypothetical protein
MTDTPKNDTQLKPDWMASVITGALQGPSQLAFENKKATDFSFESPEAYWGKDSVKEYFKNDRHAFDNFYAQQKDTWQKTKENDQTYDNFVSYEYPTRLARDLGRPIANISYKKPEIANPEGRDIFGSSVSAPKWTLESKAHEVGVKVEEGKYVSRDEFSGTARYAKNDDGTWKFNERGLPYMEAYSNEMGDWRSFDRDYSKLADLAGEYGLEDKFNAWDLLYWPTKQGLNFATTTIAALSEYVRAPADMLARGEADLTGNDFKQSTAYSEGIRKFQGAVRSQTIASSQEEMANPWDIRNLSEMGIQAGLQLASMFGVGRIAGMMFKSARAASYASRLYMTGMAAGHVAQISRETGLNEYETGALLAVTSVPYYYISQLSEEAIGLAKPLVLEKQIPDILSSTYGVTLGKSGFNIASAATYKNSVRASIANIAAGLEASPALKATTFEMTEEMLEEISESGILSLYDRIKGVDAFNVDWAEVLTQNVPLSAVGGGMGGYGMHRVLKRMGQVHPETITSIEDLAVKGEMWRFYDFVNRYEKDKRFSTDDAENKKQAQFARDVGTAIDEVWEKSGLKRAIYNNEAFARQFGYNEVLKATKIGQDVKRRSALLNNALQRREEILQKQGSKTALPQGDVEKLENDLIRINNEIASIESENELINRGDRLNRYITEGLYNIWSMSDEDLKAITGRQLDVRNVKLEGDVIAKMNIESYDSKKSFSENRAKNLEQLQQNDTLVNLSNFKDLKVSRAGLQNLRSQISGDFNALITANPEAYRKLSEIVSQLPEYAVSLESTKSDDADSIADGLYYLTTDFVQFAADNELALDQDVLNLLNQFKEKSDFYETILKKNSDEPADLGEDAHLLSFYDDKTNKTTLPYEYELTNEETLQGKNTKENELYVSAEPARIEENIKRRIRQIVATEKLGNNDRFIKANIVNPQDTLIKLSQYLDRAIYLRQKSEQNASNTDATVKRVYLDKIDKITSDFSDKMTDIAKAKIFSDFEKVNQPATALLNDIKNAILKNDVESANTLMREFEVFIYDNFKDKRKEVLAAIHPKFQNQVDKRSEEGIRAKNLYDFIRGVTAIHPFIVYDAYEKSVRAMSESYNAPTFEQRNVAVNAFRSMIAGEYLWNPFDAVQNSNYNYAAGIDGGAGTGKTSVLIPLLASMANKVFSQNQTSGKVIVTAFQDEINERKSNLEKAAEGFFNGKQEWLSFSSDSLVDIIKKAGDDTNLIIFDEATLLNKSVIDEAQKELDRINDVRIKASKSPLFITYTYDRYQNAPKKGGKGESIGSLRVNIPTTQRLSFSFRSQNRSLKLFEEWVRENINTKGTAAKELVLSHQGFDGVQVFNNRESFEKAAIELAQKMNADGKKDSLFYLTTDSTVPSITGITGLGVHVMDTYNAQGRERDYVILDDSDGLIFKDDAKSREYYTGGTRAKKGLIVYVSPDLPIKSITASVGEFKPISPSAVSREQDLSELEPFLKKYENDESIKKSAFFSAANKPVKSIVPPVGQQPPPPEQQEMFDYGTIDGQLSPDREEVAKMIMDGLKPENKIQISTFYTPTGTDIAFKRKLIYDDEVKNTAKYYLTVTNANQPGYDNYVNTDIFKKNNYQDRLIVAVEGSLGDKRAVVGVLMDMHDELKALGIEKKFVDGKISIPISNSLIKNAVQTHPWIENNDRKKVSKKSRRTLSKVKTEPHGLTISDVMIATQSIYGFHGDADGLYEKVPKGTPFVVLSYKHTKEQLNQILKNNSERLFSTRSQASDLQVLGLDRNREVFGEDSVYELIKPYLYPKNGDIMVDRKKDENGFYKLRDTFWAHLMMSSEYNKKKEGDAQYTPTFQPDYEKLYTFLTDNVGGDVDVKAYFDQNIALHSAAQEKIYQRFDLRWLFDDYMRVLHTKKNPDLGIKVRHEEGITKAMNAAKVFLGGGFKMDVTIQTKSTSRGSYYAFAQKTPGDTIDNLLTANYWFLSPPKLVTDKQAILREVSNAANSNPAPPIPSGSDETSPDVLGGNNSLKKLSISQFLLNEFPNDSVKGYKALRMFRADVVNARLKLNTKTPSIVNINDAVTTLKAEYSNPVNTTKKRVFASRDIAGALHRNFDGLLALYFPEVAYDPDRKIYYQQTGNKKAGYFSEKEESFLLTDGMNNIVKSYLYNTPLISYKTNKDGTSSIEYQMQNGAPVFFNKKHLQSVIPFFRNTDDIGDVIRNLSKSTNPAAVTLYRHYFANIANEELSSVYVIPNNDAQALVTALHSFLKSAEEYIPGFTLHKTSTRGYNEEVFTVSSREQKYPINGFRPALTEMYFLRDFNNTLLRLKQSKNISVEGKEMNYNGVIFRKDTVTPEQAVQIIQQVIPDYTKENWEQLMKYDPMAVGNQTTYIKGINDYFFSTVSKYLSKDKEPIIGESAILGHVFDQYISDSGLGNNFTFQAADGSRQYILRQTSPIMRLPEEINYLRNTVIGENKDHILAGNVLVREDGPIRMSKLPPINHQGIRIKSTYRDTSKSLSDMSVEELLEVYMLDGFVNQIVRDDKEVKSVILPVTVFADSGQELHPVFESKEWLTRSTKIAEDIFTQREHYYTRVSRDILNKYSREYKISATSIGDLANKVAKANIPLSDIQSKKGFVKYLHYDVSNKKTATIAPSLINEINRYVGPNRDQLVVKFHDVDLAATLTTLFKYAESDESRNGQGLTLKEQIDTVIRSNESLRDKDFKSIIGSFYTNWLLAKDSFEQIMTGSLYQYKGSNQSKKLGDLVKRAKLTESPGSGYVYRANRVFEEGLQKARQEGKPISARLMYEGKKLNKNYKIAVFEDSVKGILQLDDGTVSPLDVYDGATFKSPITTLMQGYSAGLSYGFTTDVVMKNITKTMDYSNGVSKAIKNAEFELTPEILRRGTPRTHRLARAFFTQQFEVNGVPVEIDGKKTPLDFLKSYGLDTDTFANVEAAHFNRLLDDLVQNGVQDSLVMEIVHPSSMKTGVEAVNSLSNPDEAVVTQTIDIRHKLMQQDAIKDPSKGLDVKVLTQLVQAISMNWVDPDTLSHFYNTLSQITKIEVDKLRSMPDQQRDAIVKKLIENDLNENEEINYRTEALAANLLSKNDRPISTLYSEKFSSYVEKKAVAYALRGGHYIVHPTDGLIHVYDVKDTETGRTITVMKDQLLEFNSERYEISTPRDLRYTDAIRQSDGQALTSLYDAAASLKGKNGEITPEYVAEIQKIHQSLKTDQWSVGEAEILLPAEMGAEFMLQEAIASNMIIGDIDSAYFLKQILKGKEESEVDAKQLVRFKRRAEKMYESFNKRLEGIVTRIPTSGKHSALSTRVVGFMNGSKNSVFIPAALLKIQGADQDIDKGSYLTYKTVVKYRMKNHYGGRTVETYSPDDYPGYYIASREYTGIIVENEKDIQDFYKIYDVKGKENKDAIQRIMLENSLVTDIKNILNNPKTIVEANTSVDKTMDDLADEAKLEEDSQVPYNPDDIMSYLRIHELNQAGGKSLTGIYANSNKAYHIAYIASKLSGKDYNVFGINDEDNQIWKNYASRINATVDNANLNYLGPNRINNITAPWDSYLISMGMSTKDVKNFFAAHKQLFDELKAASRYDRKKAFNPEKSQYLKDNNLYGLYQRVQEFALMSRVYLNRKLEVRQEDVINYITSINSYIAGKTGKQFDIMQFSADENYASEMIAAYESTILKTPDGQIAPESVSHYNILAILKDAPHIREYVNGMIETHKYNMSQKAYAGIYNIMSRIRNPYMTPGLYTKVEDFVYSSFIDTYLHKRDFNKGSDKITDFDIRTPEGRVQFLTNMVNDLGDFRRKDSSNFFTSNLKARDSYEYGTKTDYKWVGTVDFFEMNEDKKIMMLQGFKTLPYEDKLRIFISNLIVTRDRTFSGSLTPFITPDVKRDWIDFMDFELNVDNDKLYEGFEKYQEQLNADSDERGPIMAIPFNLELPTQSSNPTKVETYKGKGENSPEIKIYHMPHIRSASARGTSHVSYSDDGTGQKMIAINPTMLQEEFNRKEWSKKTTHLDGTTSRGLKPEFFENYKQYEKFVIAYEYGRLTNNKNNYISMAQFHDQMVRKAVKDALGKDIPEFKTEEKYRDEFNKCQGLK